MSATMQSLGIDALPRDEQIALVREIWNHIAASGDSLLTPNQREDLRRRMAEDDADPDAGIPWEEVKAAALKRIRP